MTDAEHPRWWDEPERLDDADLQRLLRAAASLLSRRGDADLDVQDVTEIPPSAVVEGLREALAHEGIAVDEVVARRLVDGPLARDAAPGLLRELGRETWLRESIDDAYRADGQLMVLDPGTLAVAAVVLLAVKVRKIRIGRTGVEMSFDPIRAGLLASIVKLLER